MDASERFSDEAAEFLRKAIRESDGNEVFAVGSVDETGLVAGLEGRALGCSGRECGAGLPLQERELGGELLPLGLAARQPRLEVLDLDVLLLEGAPELVAVAAIPVALVGRRGALEDLGFGTFHRGLSAERTDEALVAVVVDDAMRQLTGEQRTAALRADGAGGVTLTASEESQPSSLLIPGSPKGLGRACPKGT